MLEGFTVEMRERMNTSIYWSENRSRKKCIVGTICAIKELFEVSWQIYGIILYFSKEADGCSD
jgi:hypothetical protein